MFSEILANIIWGPGAPPNGQALTGMGAPPTSPRGRWVVESGAVHRCYCAVPVPGA